MFPSHLPTPRRPAAQSIPILRWGIIGPGWIAERFVHSLKTYSRQQVVAVVSRSQAKADRVAAEWGIPQAYGQVEEMLAPESRYLLPQEQAEQPQAWEEQRASAEQAAPV